MTAQKKKAASKLSFGEAVEEVEAILAQLEAEEVDIDDLAGEVQRAVELIKVCRQKLTRTDAEVRTLVADLQAEPTDEPPAAEPPAAEPDGVPF